MRFIDSSVFVYAYLRPMKKIPPAVMTMKGNARKIIARISNGEPAATSLIHMSEIANILESRMPLIESLELLSGLFDMPSLLILDSNKELYETAIEESRSSNIGVNDALANLLMRDSNINQVYSFDKDFDRIEGVTRITE